MESFEPEIDDIKKIKFFSFGSPLIDIIADVEDEFIQK